MKITYNKLDVHGAFLESLSKGIQNYINEYNSFLIENKATHLIDFLDDYYGIVGIDFYTVEYITTHYDVSTRTHSYGTNHITEEMINSEKWKERLLKEIDSLK